MIWKYLITLKDIGFSRTKSRIIYELKRKIENLIPSKLLHKYYFKKKAIWSNILQELDLNKKYSQSEELFLKDQISFNFLNQEKIFSYPINWNDKNLPKLWRYNLHYFDWAKNWLKNYVRGNDLNNELDSVPFIIDDWIKNNPLGKGDGWHSYTISLRIRNWVWLFRFRPDFVNQERLNYLWIQLLWLDTHPEDFYGGNHWIENICAKIVCSLNFESKYSKKILNQSLNQLSFELKNQILEDGGHEERSISYHILILDRLLEVGFLIEKINKSRPDWLVINIEKMFNFIKKIRLENGNYPRFNDNGDNLSPTVDEVIFLSIIYLKKDERLNKQILFANQITKNFEKSYKENIINLFDKNKIINDFPDSGIYIIKPGLNWEFVMKCGTHCPRHLPAHVHSDSLSFDLYKNGNLVFAEAGCSGYDNLDRRKYERSGKAHNIFQLGLPAKHNINIQNVNWIESIEVWERFRAARKSRCLQRSCEINKNNEITIIGSYDTYIRFGADYQRKIKIRLLDKGFLSLKIMELVICKRNLFWRQIFHLSKDCNEKLLLNHCKKMIKDYSANINWEDQYYSNEFGKFNISKSLIVSGFLAKGSHVINSELLIPPTL